MPRNVIVSSDIDESPDKEALKELRNLLSLKGIDSEENILEIWKSLRKMQEELALPSLYPVRQHYYFFQKLIEIQKVVNLSFAADKENIKNIIYNAISDIKENNLKNASEKLNKAFNSISRLGTKEKEAKKIIEDATQEIKIDFKQLNQLYIEINTLRKFYKLPETTPMLDIITMIKRRSLQELALLGIGSDSLILKVLLFDLTSTKQKVSQFQELLNITNDLDREIFQILVAYGPLSRPEIVQLTGIARSSIYDSLQRLIVKGFTVQYKEKRSHTGRPTTVFDAQILNLLL
ncbi:MAG: helix-turn-helix domain-containing protein [Candidatus Hodarchaeales archaeon]|jgi:biotin operon repressor